MRPRSIRSSGDGEPQLHQRQQRVTAGQVLGVLAVLGREAERLVDRRGATVGERRWDHLPAPPRCEPRPLAPPARCCGSRCSGRCCPPGRPAPPPPSATGSPSAATRSPSRSRGCRTRTAGRGSRGTPSARRASRRLSEASPSSVVTSRPSACAASTVQDLTDSPSSSTVQAPQEVVSQPMLVAVRSATSRRKCTSSVRSSTSAVISLPLTVSETFTWRSPSSLPGLRSTPAPASSACRCAGRRGGRRRRSRRCAPPGWRRWCRPRRCP